MRNSNALVTIVTPDYLDRALVAIQSAKKYNTSVDYHILYMDTKIPYKFKNVKIITLKDIEYPYTHLAEKYGHLSNESRWCLKPVVLLYLLNFYQKVIYIDPDIFFINSWNFLYDKINSMILTPHFWHNNNISNQVLCEKIFEYGYFNAGFIGVSRNAFEPLRFWADCCYTKCEKNRYLGLYDDQKYLDIIYSMKDTFPDVESIEDHGCNICSWNDDYHIPKIKSGIFIHTRPYSEYSASKYKNTELIKNIQKYYKLINKTKLLLLK